MEFAWTCQYCGHKTVITPPNYSDQFNLVATKRSKLGTTGVQHLAIACPNDECRELTFEVRLRSVNLYPSGNIESVGDSIHEWRLLPESEAKPQPEYIPVSIRRSYYEACRIVHLSPTASAALARRCLQGMIRDFWQVPDSKRGNLGAEISYIKDRVDPTTFQAILDVRSIGDIGAHMDKFVDQIVDIEPDEAELLIELIETLFKDWYVQKHERTARNAKLTGVVAAKRAQQKENKAARKALDLGDDREPEVGR